MGTDTSHTTATCGGPCPQGRYCLEGTVTPTPCAAGFYMPVTGAASAESCIPCSPGHSQSNPGADSCDACPAGTFANQLNATGCTDCPAGSFCPHIGTVQALECPAGRYQNETRRTECTQCPPGRFQPERGQTSCDRCDAGGFCNNTEECGGGFTPCRAGTYNEEEGSS